MESKQVEFKYESCTACTMAIKRNWLHKIRNIQAEKFQDGLAQGSLVGSAIHTRMKAAL